MKPLTVLLWLMFVFAIPKALFTNSQEYVRFISDVYKMYRASSIIIYFGSDTGASEKNEIFNIAITFSRKRIMTVLANFEQVEKMKLYYNEQEREVASTNLPLFVTFITTEKSLQNYIDQLQQATNQTLIYMRHLFRTLILFMKINGENEKPLLDFCRNPVGNPFGLRFDSQVLVKCYDDTQIREWYSVIGNETDIKEFAKWDNRLVRLNNLTIYRRRGGLRGKILKIATNKDSVVLTRKGKELVGYIGKILELIQEALNFSLKFVSEENSIGNWNESTKTWSGVMNLLNRAEVDLAADITLNAKRSRYVEFTTPLITAENCLYIMKPKGSLQWTGHVKPFSKSIWISVVLFVLATPILLTLVKMKIQPFQIFSSLISENYLNVWGIFCQQGLTESPTTTTLRIAYFSICSLAAVIWSAYCASFTSIVNVPQSDMELKSVDDFVADASYKLIVVKDSSDYSLFQHAAGDDTSKAMTRLMLKKEKLPANVNAGFKMVCEQKVGFYINHDLKKLVESDITCEVYEIPTRRFDQMGITLPKNSQYRDVLNYYIQKLKHSGLLNRFEIIYFNMFLDTRKLPREKYKQVALPVIALPLAIMMLGIILGSTLFCLEKSFFYCKNRKKRNKVQALSPNTRSSISLKELPDFCEIKNDESIEERVLNLKFLQSNYEHRIVVTPDNEAVNFQI